MPRNRIMIKPNNTTPYELSYSRFKKFVKFLFCFYLTQVKDVQFLNHNLVCKYKYFFEVVDI